MLGTDRTRDRGENQNKREGDWMLIHTGGWGGGHYFIHSFSQTGKVVEELLEFKHLHLLKLEFLSVMP